MHHPLQTHRRQAFLVFSDASRYEDYNYRGVFRTKGQAMDVVKVHRWPYWHLYDVVTRQITEPTIVTHFPTDIGVYEDRIRKIIPPSEWDKYVEGVETTKQQKALPTVAAMADSNRVVTSNPWTVLSKRRGQ